MGSSEPLWSSGRPGRVQPRPKRAEEHHVGHVEKLSSGRFRGRPVNPKTGERLPAKSFDTKAEADAYWRRAQQDAVLAYRKQGLHVPEPPREAVTFAVAAQAWLDRRTGLTSGSRSWY